MSATPQGIKPKQRSGLESRLLVGFAGGLQGLPVVLFQGRDAVIGRIALAQTGVVQGPGVTGDGVGQELVGFLTGQADDVEALGGGELLLTV